MTELATPPAPVEPVRSLTDFAQHQGNARRRCILCSVPVEIEQQAQEGKTAGVTYKIIGQWLASLGYADSAKPPTQARLQRHFQDAHTPGAS